MHHFRSPGSAVWRASFYVVVCIRNSLSKVGRKDFYFMQQLRLRIIIYNSCLIIYETTKEVYLF